MDEISKAQLIEILRDAITKSDDNYLSQRDFLRISGLKKSDVFRYFERWSAALDATGLEVKAPNQKIAIEDLLTDWGDVARSRQAIPTRNQYKLDGSFSPTVYERQFGPWSAVPSHFRQYAIDKPEWVDVVALIPNEKETTRVALGGDVQIIESQISKPISRFNPKLEKRPTYGNPIDFRGLRHEPVNENGVVFLFGMVARELGYWVESVQAGYPDCEAKRQVSSGKWQRVSIEFEFESRNFKEHGHPTDGCDVIVCWRHNWFDCPPSLEVIELSKVIETLAKSEE